MFLLFLLPGLPKDLLSYAAGFSGMTIIEFLVLSGLARSPALLASVMIGAGVSRGDYRSVIAISLLVLLAIGGDYWHHPRERAATSAASSGPAQPRPEAPTTREPPPPSPPQLPRPPPDAPRRPPPH